MRDRGETIRNGAIQLLLAVNAVIMIYPLFVMVASSFKTNAEIFSSPLSLPTHFSTANLEKVWTETNFVRYLANSVGITAASVALILLFSTLAGYAIARYRFRLSSLVLMFFLSGMTVPLKLAIIPLFIQLDTLGLVDSYLGLVLVYVAMGIPSAVFIMTGFLRTLPRELEESARMDGASELRIMWSIMLPLARPALVIVAIQNAVPIWNDFFFPLVLITSDNLKTLPQGLTVFVGEFTTDWGVLFTGLTLAALPITLLYIVLSKQFISGITQGAVK
ncbi:MULTISPECIES: carbohydrate ABC transporter permease [unclassified Mesorhizobium]|jgi:raffinose/stachyose/melibiose transport system permease protein|uniref:carbohydrate ABC transporter permease n=1 Tax=unclassified Mesorhizobium TaxID=325217 RepID=UPI000FDBC6A5|nr:MULTISPECIES: carbohydrate ABC transporter permease [unclassified Mesorhizobium]TGQ16748.1 carbohydrate ABC transporter permease [Mesorhizobium sp. M2E.F.Ca.ET.219.01.1.1]TGT78020.1 carbohydrate ABC transporter permease [Mesorhizobium sp. M2E.F.Ca.ET.166.01.1.1]TGW04138.1 carbohydrate ABC transporter permease [Mesorhizobium sp. M2E.F.Ca.ET.154.01.1.1]TPJ36725.1 carbohydrate ABC transporter permease [Mesorhizobium sp. B2-8-3]